MQSRQSILCFTSFSTFIKLPSTSHRTALLKQPHHTRTGQERFGSLVRVCDRMSARLHILLFLAISVNHTNTTHLVNTTQSQIFYKDALAALLVYDCTRPDSFDAIAKWKGEIDEKVSLPNGDPLPVYLLANKVRM